MAKTRPEVTELPGQEIGFLFGTMMDLRMLPSELKHTGKVGKGDSRWWHIPRQTRSGRHRSGIPHGFEPSVEVYTLPIRTDHTRSTKSTGMPPTVQALLGTGTNTVGRRFQPSLPSPCRWPQVDGSGIRRISQGSRLRHPLQWTRWSLNPRGNQGRIRSGSAQRRRRVSQEVGQPRSRQVSCRGRIHLPRPSGPLQLQRRGSLRS